MTTEQNQIQVAQEILNQLGGNKFKMMTGAKEIYATERGLQMKIGRNAAGINKVVIELNQYDLYDMKFLKVSISKKTWDCTVTTVAQYNSIYGDVMRELFTVETGLYTSL